LDVDEGFYMDQKKLFILLNCGTDELRSDQVPVPEDMLYAPI
jgi:hypothetical protein